MPESVEIHPEQKKETSPGPKRLESIDQFRGFTVAGMFLVNFVGGYQCIPAFFRHQNTYCSFADTIMPQFFLAVGLTFRMTYMRRLASDRPRSAFFHALSRNLGLLLLGFVVHGLDGSVRDWTELQVRGWRLFIPDAFERNFFQTLTIIALTSLWVLPVISGSALIRIYWMCFSVAVWLVFALVPAPWSGNTYVDFALARPVIDGGPLAFLTWSIPLLVGSLAYDWMNQPKGGQSKILGFSLILMVGGYLVSCIGQEKPAALPFVPPPASPSDTTLKTMASKVFAKVNQQERSEFLNSKVNAWSMSQRVSGPSYLMFAAGFGLLVFQCFRWFCDGLHWRSAVFHTLGINALAGYVIHPMVASKIKPFVPGDAPLGYVMLAFGWYFLITWALLKHLENTKTFIRL